MSLRGFLHNQLVQGQISYGPLQARILSFQILEPFRLIEFEASILLAPAIVRGVSDTPLAANILDRLPLGQEDFPFAELANDVFDGVLNAWLGALLSMSQACNRDLGVV